MSAANDSQGPPPQESENKFPETNEAFMQEMVGHLLTPDLYLHTAEFKGDPHKMTSLWWGRRSTIAEVAKIDATKNTYFSVSAFEKEQKVKSGRTLEESKGVIVFMIDDPDITKPHLPAQFINRTSPGKFQFLFQLAELLPTDDDTIALHKAVNASKKADKGGHSCVRYARLPYGVHGSHGNQPCAVEAWQPEIPPYTKAELMAFYVDGDMSGAGGGEEQQGPQPQRTWQTTAKLEEAVRSLASLHPPIVILAGRYFRQGMSEADVIAKLKSLIPDPATIKVKVDRERAEARLEDLKRCVEDARKFLNRQQAARAEAEDSDDGPPDIRPPSDPPIPPLPDFPPGAVGEVAKLAMCMLKRESPALAWMIGLAVVSACTLNRYAVDSDYETPLALYLCAIAETGIGKETLKNIFEMVEEALPGMLPRMWRVENIPSEAAFRKMLEADPRHVFIYDEWGQGMLAARTGQASGGWKAETFRMLTKIFGKEFGDLPAQPYADDKKNLAAVKHPFMVLAAATVARPLFAGLTTLNVEDGSLNRVVYIEEHGTPPRNLKRKIVKKLDASLIAMLKALTGGQMISGYSPGAPKIHIAFANLAAWEIFDKWRLGEVEEYVRRGPSDIVGSHMFKRAEENTLRVVGTIEAGINQKAPSISVTEIERSIAFMRHCVLGMLANAREEIDKAPFEETMTRIVRKLKLYGGSSTRGKVVGWDEYLRKKVQRRMIDDARDRLIEVGTMQVEYLKGGERWTLR